MLPPLQNVVGPEAVIVAAGEPIETLVVAVPDPHALLTDTDNPTLPAAPAVYVIEGVPCPAVIVPFVIVQL